MEEKVQTNGSKAKEEKALTASSKEREKKALTKNSEVREENFLLLANWSDSNTFLSFKK